MKTIKLTLPGGGQVVGCEALLLDMDGVLVDSLAVIERHLREWAMRHGLDPQHVIDVSHGRTNTELVAELAPGLDAGAEARRMVDLEITDVDGITACPGAADLLAQIPGGSWAVVTSGHRPVAHGRLKAAGLPVPGVLITADDVLAGKPDPDGYRQAARRLGVSPDNCVVIEDAPAGIRAAHAAGMRSIEMIGNRETASGLSDHSLRSLDLLQIKVFGPSSPAR
jgi:sugar-phosphatase